MIDFCGYVAAFALNSAFLLFRAGNCPENRHSTPCFGDLRTRFGEEQGIVFPRRKNRANLQLLAAAQYSAGLKLPVFVPDLREIPCYQGRDGFSTDCVAHHYTSPLPAGPRQRVALEWKTEVGRQKSGFLTESYLRLH